MSLFKADETFSVSTQPMNDLLLVEVHDPRADVQDTLFVLDYDNAAQLFDELGSFLNGDVDNG